MSNRPPPSPLPRLRVVAHSLDHAVAALNAAAGVAIVVESPPSAAGAQGAGWFKALMAQARAEVPAAEVVSLLDCGDAPGLALAAIRSRAADAVRVAAPAEVAAKLAQIAAHEGMAVETVRAEALDLLASTNPLTDCLVWFGND